MGNPTGLMSPIYPHVTGGIGLHKFNKYQRFDPTVHLIGMMVIGIFTLRSTSDCKLTNGDASVFSYKKFPTFSQQILKKVNVYKVFAQYMLV